jgi:filamentous hemagglutinin family protein
MFFKMKYLIFLLSSLLLESIFRLTAIAQTKPALVEETPASFLAQVTPDGTTSTTVTPTDTGVQIDDGNSAGGNLFHSFGDFSVPTGSEAYFNNANDIVNIFSRVTGGNISNIDGLLRANGTANLFLINPAGILFGENARLQLGGSFYGSTADSIIFPDGEFSATDLENPPLITINAPIGLNFRDEPENIINQSTANNLGLQINSGETISLIGGEIAIVGNGIPSPENEPISNITAQGAKVWLGGLAEAGTINLDANLNPSLPNDVVRADVNLSNGARIDVASASGGEINLIGNNITLTEASQLFAGITDDSTSIEAQAGDVSINATGAVSLSQESSILNRVFEKAIGNSGDINVTAESLSLTEGSSFSASLFTFSRGTGGDINVNTTGAVTLDGVGENGERSRIASVIFEGAEGDGGDINIEAGSLSITNGAVLNTSVFGVNEELPGGKGDAGNITINTEGTITISGFNKEEDDVSEPSSIISTLRSGAEGNAGNVTIEAQNLTLENRGLISTSTLGTGNAGNVTVEAQNLTLENRGLIDSSTFGRGNAGEVTINVDSLSLLAGGQIKAILGVDEEEEIAGEGNAGNISLDVSGDILLSGSNEVSLSSAIFSRAETGTVGNAGNVTIEAQNLTLENRSFISSSTFGTGDAGEIEVITGNLNLTNNSEIVARVFDQGQGGNITLSIAENILLQKNSQISAEAVENATGGNLNIDTNFILAYPSNGNGNDILASAEQGKGGNIEIEAEALFGIEQSQAFDNNNRNDIDASSQAGVDGTVSINTPDSNPIRESKEFSQNIFTSTMKTNDACSVSETGKIETSGGLVVKGKGGVPPEITEPLNAENLIVDGETTSNTSQNNNNVGTFHGASLQNPEEIPNHIQPVAYRDNGEPIYLARGAIVQENGTVILTAYETNNLQPRTPENLGTCN